MIISMYQASTPRFVNALKNLSAILDKAQAHADAKKIEPTVLTHCRLFPDMFPMKRQVQIACDTAKRSEEHTSELQSRPHLVCRLLLEKKKTSPIQLSTSCP